MTHTQSTRILAATLCLSGLGAAASAQDAGWSYDLSSYMWFPNTVNKVDTPYGIAQSELSVGDALDALDFGVMVSGTARRGPWAFTGDLVHLDLTADSAAPLGVFYSGVRTATKLTALSGYALYEIAGSQSSSLEVGGGVRAVESTLDLSFDAGVLPGTSQRIKDNWADALIALRYRHQFDTQWNAALAVDYGGFGIGDSSDKTWQVVATIGYAFNENWTMVGGYRHLFVDRSNDGTDYSLEMSGPLLGVTYRF